MNLKLYRDHLTTLQSEWEDILVANELDAVVLHAGANSMYYDDDQHPPFHANPYFLRWIPHNECEHSIVVIAAGEKPRVFWYAPDDYWYLPTSAPDWLEESMDCAVYSDKDEQLSDVSAHLGQKRNVVISPNRELFDNLANAQNASQKLNNQMAYWRGYKTEFEIDNMVAATEVGVRGHLAAREAFRAGGSEFQIHMAYLNASEQLFHELPYPNIIALNNHGATLHNQHYDREVPEPLNSLLIDAGGKHNCYHSDITRTYSSDEANEFADLIRLMDEHQQALCQVIHNGIEYVALHEKSHEAIASVLSKSGVVRCSPESALDQDLTRTFFPHGVGHLLGLQTHDVGGNVVSSDGAEGTPPEEHPMLRLLRVLGTNSVFTVEPGIYFIPMLLDEIRGHKDVNWSKVDRLLPFGGVRIEDNVQVLDEGVRNLTREAFLKFESASAS